MHMSISKMLMILTRYYKTQKNIILGASKYSELLKNQKIATYAKLLNTLQKTAQERITNAKIKNTSQNWQYYTRGNMLKLPTQKLLSTKQTRLQTKNHTLR